MKHWQALSCTLPCLCVVYCDRGVKVLEKGKGADTD